MAKEKPTGLMMNGTLKASGVTFYFRNGQMIMRSAHSNEKRSNTRGQFIARQRMKHSIALWQRLKPLNPMFIGGKSTYTAFTSLANRLPVVFCPDSSSLLMPGIPVSSGPMPSMEQRLDIIEGTPALVTDLKRSDLQRGDHLMLYTAQQTTQGRKPVVTFSVRKMATADFITVDGCLFNGRYSSDDRIFYGYDGLDFPLEEVGMWTIQKVSLALDECNHLDEEES